MCCCPAAHQLDRLVGVVLQANGGGASDPVMTGFDGKSFHSDSTGDFLLLASEGYEVRGAPPCPSLGAWAPFRNTASKQDTYDIVLNSAWCRHLVQLLRPSLSYRGYTAE